MIKGAEFELEWKRVRSVAAILPIKIKTDILLTQRLKRCGLIGLT
jgi:hypothetical protein